MIGSDIGRFGVIATGGRNARIIRWATQSTVNHAFVFVGARNIVEAQPGGAVVSQVDKYDPAAITWSPRLSYNLGQRVAFEALQLVGTPYSWLDIACIALAQRKLGSAIDPHIAISDQPFPWRPILERVRDSDRLICSQLVDVAYHRAGVELFDDGRFPGLVSPGDLLQLINTRKEVLTR